MLNEPGEVTNVVDAFDDEAGNPFDLFFTLGFQQTWQNAKIQRETFLSAPDNPGLSSGGFVSSALNVASYKESTSRLHPRVDIGIYKDIAAYLRLPIILNNTRELGDLNGSQRVQNATLLGGYNADGSPEQLFRLPFASPSRSGIEYLAIGADVGIFNQTRDPAKPTWVIGGEVRLNVSEPMHACTRTPGANAPRSRQVGCSAPSDVNRNGVAGDVRIDSATGPSLEGSFAGGRSPGVSRGTTGLELHTMLSKRVRYTEPYGGFRALFEFANANSDYSVTDSPTTLVAKPPLQGSFFLGLMVVPYEIREDFQRLTFDTRVTGTYRSQGRDYSPLFDALGSSDAGTLRRPNYSGYQVDRSADSGGRSVVEGGSPRVYVSGLTEVAPHALFSLSGSAQFQTNKYLKFQLGAAYTRMQSHAITGTQPCNSSYLDNPGRSGPCQVLTNQGPKTSGVPDPTYRAVTDDPGRRFYVSSASQIDLWVHAVLMF